MALAISGEGIVAERFLSRLAGWAAPVEESVADGLRELADWIPLPPEEAAALVSGVGCDPCYEEDGWRGISPFVTPSVLWSLYSFLRSPEDYWETMCAAIAVGAGRGYDRGHGWGH